MENSFSWNSSYAKQYVKNGSLKGRTQLLKRMEGLRMSSWMLQLVAKGPVEQNMRGEKVALQLATFIPTKTKTQPSKKPMNSERDFTWVVMSLFFTFSSMNANIYF